MGSLDRDGIVAAMNSLDKLTFDGLAGDYGYGTPDQRDPARVTTMFKVNPAAPFGLESLKYNFASDAAKAFEFPTGTDGTTADALMDTTTTTSRALPQRTCAHEGLHA